MLLLFFYGFIFSLFFAFFLCALIGWFVYRFVKQRAKRRKLRLGGYQRRLKIVVAELLNYSNEMDQISKYVGLDKDATWSKKYRETLNRLLSASEKLSDSQTFLDAGELVAAQECLLFVARSCFQVWREFRAIKPKESFESLHQFAEEAGKAGSGGIANSGLPSGKSTGGGAAGGASASSAKSSGHAGSVQGSSSDRASQSKSVVSAENAIEPSTFLDGEAAGTAQNDSVEKDEGVIIRLPREKKKNRES